MKLKTGYLQGYLNWGVFRRCVVQSTGYTTGKFGIWQENSVEQATSFIFTLNPASLIGYKVIVNQGGQGLMSHDPLAS
jgi:hypothetical protein